ncbi:MAG: hypothetical protein OEY06_10385 [Gammaproteobacteria bacterium]|nr:hypothetical protein [Gammaproteobacteria bacterium]
MNTAITISAVSSIIACGAFWVSYRAYKLSEQGRINDKLLEFRINFVELKSRIAEAQRNFNNVESSSAISIKINEELNKLLVRAENLDKKMYGDLSHLNEKKIADATVMLSDIRIIADSLNEKINKLQKA